METITLPEKVDIQKLAEHLAAFLDNETYDVHLISRSDDQIKLQVSNDRRLRSGSRISVVVSVINHAESSLIQIGDPEWMNIAGSIGATLLGTLIRSVNIIGRIDDLSVDLNNVQLPDRVKQLVNDYVTALIAEKTSARNRTKCQYCGSRNSSSATHCKSCGAPLI